MALDFIVDSFRQELPEKSLRDKCVEDLTPIIKQFNGDVTDALNLVESLGLPVVHVSTQFHIRALMMFAGVDYGFVSPHTPHYAKLVETLHQYFPDKVGHNFNSGLMLINENNHNVLFLIMAIYHWQACKLGLPGYSETACKLYRDYDKKYRGELPPRFINKLGLEELAELRAVIKRQEESIRFLKEMVESIIVPKNNSKLLGGKSASA